MVFCGSGTVFGLGSGDGVVEELAEEALALRSWCWGCWLVGLCLHMCELAVDVCDFDFLGEDSSCACLELCLAVDVELPEAELSSSQARWRLCVAGCGSGKGAWGRRPVFVRVWRGLDLGSGWMRWRRILLDYGELLLDSGVGGRRAEVVFEVVVSPSSDCLFKPR
jgi:hypothetical protein